jgi:LemA protein
MKELSMTENRIASHRKYYNANVKEYKLYVRMFPQNMFLDLLGYKPVDYKLLDFEDAPVNAPTGLLKD